MRIDGRQAAGTLRLPVPLIWRSAWREKFRFPVPIEGGKDRCKKASFSRLGGPCGMSCHKRGMRASHDSRVLTDDRSSEFLERRHRSQSAHYAGSTEPPRLVRPFSHRSLRDDGPYFARDGSKLRPHDAALPAARRAAAMSRWVRARIIAVNRYESSSAGPIRKPTMVSQRSGDCTPETAPLGGKSQPLRQARTPPPPAHYLTRRTFK